ncbi:MAG: arsenite methyltransferase [Thermoproteota archaeon]|nr:arsenite methyltransferase [Thermoproteota archaeon]
MEKERQQEIKNTIRKTYSKIALQQHDDNNTGSSSSSPCCGPDCCSGGGGEKNSSLTQVATAVGYETNELESVPQASVLGVGCGAPVKFANLQEGETVVDLGSGAGIDVFLSAKQVGSGGKATGIDMTDEMLERARRNAEEGGYTNVEFRKGDIEKRIPVDDNSADVVISNCVINLTLNKVNTFKEIHRILKNGGRGRMVISDLITDTEIPPNAANMEKWSGCIDGALTKEHYVDSIRKAGFENVEVLSETFYMNAGEQVDSNRKISSVVIKAVKR